MAGCLGLGGDQNAQTGQPGGNGGTTQPSGGGTQGTTTVPANATANVVANVSNQQSQSAADQLASIFAGAGTLNYKVTYDFSMGQGTTVTKATVVQYKKGDNIRMDTNMETQMGAISSETFILDNNTYICSKYGSQNFTCMKSSSDGSQQVPSASTLNESASTENVQLIAPTVIAGIPATCFRVISAATADYPSSSADYCVSSDGIMLSMTSSAITMTATNVERGVDDSVFTLPAQPTEATSIQ
jgi:hypothetical protein